MKTQRFITSLVIGILSVSPATAQDNDPLASVNSDPNVWNICNETSYVLRIAVGTMMDGRMTPRGWQQLRSGACISETPPPNSPRYVFAESAPVHLGRIREWTGKVKLCASRDDFTADATRSCALQDLETREFLHVNPTERNTTFIEADNFGENADTAGLQRLLRDNGYKISRIDGIPGRRTSRTLSQFIKDKDLPKTMSDGETFDALITAAQERQESIGLKICNNSTNRIWVATAARDATEWQSRGWWPIEVNDCARPITDSLSGQDAHLYAAQEQVAPEPDTLPPPDKQLRIVTAKPVQFCVGEGVFSAMGNEFCEDRGYRAVSFRPMPTDIDGTTITLTDADFTTPNAIGLRR
ncbi:DUF1036 domain-containing protein [Fretibacter rubidus]|uniref:DUF1036 domain-containing protein n=1 Tax=Fretibacter rubidus TaxID=570162 RepID=UPI00352BBDCA